MPLSKLKPQETCSLHVINMIGRKSLERPKEKKRNKHPNLKQIASSISVDKKPTSKLTILMGRTRRSNQSSEEEI